MVRINFYIQSLLIAVAIILAMACLINEQLAISFLLLQLFVGFIQYIGAWIYLAIRKRFRLLDIYLIVSTGVLGLIWIVFQSNTPQPVIIFLAFVAPWFLAIYYWFISYRILKSRHG